MIDPSNVIPSSDSECNIKSPTSKQKSNVQIGHFYMGVRIEVPGPKILLDTIQKKNS